MTSSHEQPEQPERLKLSDRAVASLPLSSGRAELLEEIMSTPVLDHRDPTPAPSARPRAQRWLVPAAAAAVVVGLVGVPVWLATDDPSREGAGDAGRPSGVAGDPSSGPEQVSGYRAVLDAPGWTVTYVQEEPPYGGEMSYSNGEQSLDIHWRPGKTYDTYVEDRSDNGPGEEIEVLGKPGMVWAYSANDHTMIREPDLGHLLEVRGSGMDRAAYLDLLGQLRLVDDAGFQAALPEEFVTDAERGAEIQAILDGIAETTYPLFPPGADTVVTSSEPDRYHLGADVSGAVACAWLAEFTAAHAAGNERRMDNASDALIPSREWPILLEMDEQGDWSEVIWEYADEVAAGRVPEGFESGLGCRS
ncbi:hypothetical protein [Nocardioides ferulae]|uniref:hypothetical protein n=1 Tax=Nocardioides ferulae TaxID=2340821 RepID=UPI000EB1618F|nr:hypothetical protein [Nocardioides ferulae]